MKKVKLTSFGYNKDEIDCISNAIFVLSLVHNFSNPKTVGLAIKKKKKKNFKLITLILQILIGHRS